MVRFWVIDDDCDERVMECGDNDYMCDDDGCFPVCVIDDEDATDRLKQNALDWVVDR